MKTMNRILLATAVSAAFALSPTAFGSEQTFQSPRAESNAIKRVGGVCGDLDLVHAAPIGVASPKSLAIQHPVVAGSSRKDLDLVHAARPHFSPKYLESFGASGPKFEIAPLK